MRQDLKLWFSGRVQEFFNMSEGSSIEKKESEMFQFWSDLSIKSKFLHLSWAALKLTSFVASEASCERLFSSVGFIYDDLRARMSPEMVAAETSIRCSLRSSVEKQNLLPQAIEVELDPVAEVAHVVTGDGISALKAQGQRIAHKYSSLMKQDSVNTSEMDFLWSLYRCKSVFTMISADPKNYRIWVGGQWFYPQGTVKYGGVAKVYQILCEQGYSLTLVQIHAAEYAVEYKKRICYERVDLSTIY